jgi:hypothetical protein
MNKYRRALDDLYNQENMTWRHIGTVLGDAIGETVHGSDAWNVWSGVSTSWKVEAGLEELGLVDPPRKRWRLAVEFESEGQRDRFRKFYGIDNKNKTMTDVVIGQWHKDDGGKDGAGNFNTDRRNGL